MTHATAPWGEKTGSAVPRSPRAAKLHPVSTGTVSTSPARHHALLMTNGLISRRSSRPNGIAPALSPSHRCSSCSARALGAGNGILMLTFVDRIRLKLFAATGITCVL